MIWAQYFIIIVFSIYCYGLIHGEVDCWLPSPNEVLKTIYRRSQVKLPYVQYWEITLMREELVADDASVDLGYSYSDATSSIT